MRVSHSFFLLCMESGSFVSSVASVSFYSGATRIGWVQTVQTLMSQLRNGGQTVEQNAGIQSTEYTPSIRAVCKECETVQMNSVICLVKHKTAKSLVVPPVHSTPHHHRADNTFHDFPLCLAFALLPLERVQLTCEFCILQLLSPRPFGFRQVQQLAH